MTWQADVVGAYDWPAYRATVKRLITHRLVRERFAAQAKEVDATFRKVQAELGAPGLTPTARAAVERRFPVLADQAQGLLDRMYPVAIEDLVGTVAGD